MVISTKKKIAYARFIQRFVMVFRRLLKRTPLAECHRSGFVWSLDLDEGIDFSIWLLGSFESETVRSYSKMVHKGDVVLDIGANMGAHTLPLARLVGDQGHVIAFEPTKYAFTKLRKNVIGNPEIRNRVTCIQAMLVDKINEHPPSAVYSSWPLNQYENLHLGHQGKLMTTEGAIATTLDVALSGLDFDRVDFIKLDIDGFECQMLVGARETLHKWQPPIIMELAPYVLEEQGASVEELLALLCDFGYSIFSLDGKTQFSIDPLVIRTLIPKGSSLNVIAKVE
jgi:FkbM family methyltransferase